VLVDPDRHKLVRPLHGKRAEAKRVHKLENRRVGAGTERQRENRHERECRVPSQEPYAVAEVLPERVEQRHRVHLVNFLADPRGVPQLPPRRMPGYVRRHAAGDVVVEFAGEVILQLVRALVIPLRSAEEAEHAHSGPQSAGRRIRLIARAISSHREVCTASCARPLGVRR
jgi:hypothetical protein